MSVTVYRLWEWKGVPISVWPHALKRGSSAALLLRLLVWIPSRAAKSIGAEMFCFCWALQNCSFCIYKVQWFKWNHKITHTTLDSPHYRAVSTRVLILEAYFSNLSPKIGYPDLYLLRFSSVLLWKFRDAILNETRVVSFHVVSSSFLMNCPSIRWVITWSF